MRKNWTNALEGLNLVSCLCLKEYTRQTKLIIHRASHQKNNELRYECGSLDVRFKQQRVRFAIIMGLRGKGLEEGNVVGGVISAKLRLGGRLELEDLHVMQKAIA